MDAMLALLPEDEVPGSLFLGLFLERLPVEMRDHLVAKKFVNKKVHRLTAETRLQDLLTLENVIFISTLEIRLTIAVLPAASRETPGPTGGGGTKQSSRRRFSYLPS